MVEQTGTPDPFTRAYVGLRSELAKAARPPGTQIRVDATAQGFGISPTPVREALARLAGERLVHGTRRQGYFVPRYSAADLAQLYSLADMHLQHAVAAIGRGSTVRLSLPETVDGERPDAGRMFVSLLALSGQPILLDAGALVIERLATARTVERDIIESTSETALLRDLVAGASATAVGKAIRAYFRLRKARAEQIAAIFANRQATGYIPDIV